MQWESGAELDESVEREVAEFVRCGRLTLDSIVQYYLGLSARPVQQSSISAARTWLANLGRESDSNVGAAAASLAPPEVG